MSARIILAFIAMQSIACSGPFVMFPGGELSGNVRPIPTDWTFTNEFENVQLETRPEDPYSVNVWGVAVGSDFYVASGRGFENAWAANIEEDPDVRLRVGADVFEMRAIRTTDAGDRDRFLVAAEMKYERFEASEDDTSKAVLYRLVPR